MLPCGLLSFRTTRLVSPAAGERQPVRVMEYAVINVNVDKPTKNVTVHWRKSGDGRRQPRQKFMVDGYWLEVRSMSEAAAIAVDLELPLRLFNTCKAQRFVGAGYE